MTKVAIRTVDVAVRGRLQNDEPRVDHRNQQFRQLPETQFRKFGKYWTTVVASPFFTRSIDFMLNSEFPFKFSRPDNMPG